MTEDLNLEGKFPAKRGDFVMMYRENETPAGGFVASFTNSQVTLSHEHPDRKIPYVGPPIRVQATRGDRTYNLRYFQTCSIIHFPCPISPVHSSLQST